MLFRIKFYEESGEEPTNCSKGFCTFDFFLGCSDERFFGQWIVVVLGWELFSRNVSQSPVRCKGVTDLAGPAVGCKSLLAPFCEGEAPWYAGEFCTAFLQPAQQCSPFPAVPHEEQEKFYALVLLSLWYLLHKWTVKTSGGCYGLYLEIHFIQSR